MMRLSTSSNGSSGSNSSLPHQVVSKETFQQPSANDPNERDTTVSVYRPQPNNSSSSPSWFIVKVTFIASLGGLLFGYDMGAVAGALPLLTETFDLTPSQQEWVVSILYLGGGVGASVGGTICDAAGRQRTILLTDAVFLLGALWLYLSNSYEMVLIGRFVVGVAVAVSGVADVAYLHEISEIAALQWRGAIVSVNEACISLGFLLAYVAGFLLSSAEDEEWRLIFGAAGVLALIQAIGMWNMPESPIWLAKKARYTESEKALRMIIQQTGEDQINPLVLQSLTNHSSETPSGSNASSLPYQSSSTARNEDFYSFDSLEQMVVDAQMTFCVKVRRFLLPVSATLLKYRRQAWIALFLAVTQQLCGQTNVLNYAPHIFAQAAGQDTPPAWSTLAIGGVKFLITVLVIWKIESIGRRFLLLAGMSLISIGLLALIVGFGGSAVTAVDSEDGNDIVEEIPANRFHFALPGVLMVVCGYSMSFGPLTWLLTSELFPTEIRGRALGASTIVTYLSASLVTKTFLSASAALGPASVFGIYFFFNTCGILFAYAAVPDTAEQTVEQIEESLHSMRWWHYESLDQKKGTDNQTMELASNGGEGSHGSLPAVS